VITFAPVGTNPASATNDALVFALPVTGTFHRLFGSGSATGLWYLLVGKNPVGPWQVGHAESGCAWPT
jgi:hypothetical protein